MQQDKGKHTTSQNYDSRASKKARHKELSIRVRAFHHGTYACIIVYTTDLKTLLLVVHDALRKNAEPMLLSTSWVPGLDVDKTMALMRQHVTRRRSGSCARCTTLDSRRSSRTNDAHAVLWRQLAFDP